MTYDNLNQKDALIIDDEPDVIELCKMYLEEIAVFRNIISARDGVDASHKLQNQKFGVILLDVNLPKKNGIELLKQIASQHHNRVQSVIMISGELDKQKIAEAVKLGLKHILIKPFDKKMFLDKIAAVAK